MKNVISGFLNPNVQFDPNNPANFNHEALARSLAARKMAARGMTQDLNRGQMVDGWFVGPSSGDANMNLLGNALGAFMNYRNQKEEQQLVKAEDDAFNFNRKLLLKSRDADQYVDDAISKHPDKSYLYAQPESVGPRTPMQASTAPVAQAGQIERTPLMMSQNTPDNAGSGGDPLRAALYSNEGYGPTGGTVAAQPLLEQQQVAKDRLAALVKSGKGQTPEAFQTRAEITKLERQINQVRLAQPLTKDGAINMPAVSREALATDAAPGSPTAPPTAPPVSLAGGIEVTDPGTKEINLPTDPTAEEDKPFVRDEAAARRIETDRLRAVQTGMQGDREAALAGLARSGDRGRQLATQIGNEEFTRRPNELKAIQTNEIHTDPETRQQYVLARQRDGSIARQNLGTVAKEDPDNRRKNDEMFMKTNTLHAEAGQRLALTNQGMSTVDDALNMAREFNAYGGVLSTAYSAIARAVGNDAANRYKTMMGSVLLDNLKAAFGANPTEGERAALADLTSNVSNGRVATEELLTRMRRLLAERQARTRLEIADLDLVKERYRPKASTSAKPNETSAPYGGRWENKQ